MSLIIWGMSWAFSVSWVSWGEYRWGQLITPIKGLEGHKYLGSLFVNVL